MSDESASDSETDPTDDLERDHGEDLIVTALDYLRRVLSGRGDAHWSRLKRGFDPAPVKAGRSGT